MVRTAGSDGVKTLEAIRKAGVKRIYKHGFEAMKLRSLAEDVGIQAGSLYNYIRNKEEFLFLLLKEVLEELLEGLERELAGIDDPKEALIRFINFHLRWHTARKEEVFIGNMELRSLSKQHLQEIIRMRTEYESRLRRILERGNEAGEWSVADPQVISYSIIASLTGVCNWYSPRGRLSQDEIIAIYTDHVLGAVGAR